MKHGALSMFFHTLGPTLTLLMGTACSTTLQVSGKNNTTQQVNLSVFAGNESTPKLERPLNPGGTIQTQQVGSFKPGTRIEIRLTLPRGGVVERRIQEMPSSPDPFTLPVQLNAIAAVELDPSDAATIERQISDITGSEIAPTDDIGALLSQYLGGLYRKKKVDDTFVFERIIDPATLGAEVDLEHFLPEGAGKPYYDLKLTVDQSNSAKIRAQLPSQFNIKTDFSQTIAYRQEFHMENTGWRGSPHSWYAVQHKLAQTDKGKQILADISQYVKQFGNLFYLDRAFVLGKVHSEVFEARQIQASADITADQFVSAGAAFQWSHRDADSKGYGNLVLRVGFQELLPFIPLPDGSIAPVDMHQKVEGFLPTNDPKKKIFHLIAVPSTRRATTTAVTGFAPIK